jgi:hypothetical protein
MSFSEAGRKGEAIIATIVLQKCRLIMDSNCWFGKRSSAFCGSGPIQNSGRNPILIIIDIAVVKAWHPNLKMT